MRRPFDSSGLSRMLEGLEASIISLREWHQDNAFLRLDSEYHRKAHLAAIESLKQFGAVQLKQDSPEIIHPQEIRRNYVEDDGVWFLRAQNVRPLKIDPTNKVFISQRDAETLSRNQVRANDVLITRTGANRGECATYDRNQRAIASSHTFIVRPRKIKPQFLSLFLNGRYGKAQIDRGVYGAAQPEIAPYYLGNIWVPAVSDNLVSRLTCVYHASTQAMANFEARQGQAEQVLLSALGMADWTPPEALTYGGLASNAIAANRIDAQYYMPAKEEVRRSLAALPGQTLGDCVDSIRELFVPDRVSVGMRIRNYDVTDALAPVLDTEKKVSIAAEINSVKKVFMDGDVVISRLRSYLREIAVVQTEENIPSVGSSEFIVLRVRDTKTEVKPETLMVFLRSAPVQTILKWCQDGSQHPRFSETDLLRIPLPDAIARVSGKVTAIVQESFSARRRARQLRRTVLQAVEIAIEDGEAVAQTFLDRMKGEV